MKRFAWVLLGLTLLVTPAMPAPPAAPPVCRRLPLNPRPAQVSAMVWSLDGRELAMTDVVAHQLLRYRPDGSLLGAVAKPPFVHGDFKPTQVHAIPDGFLVRNSAYDWLWFDRAFKPLRAATQGLPPRFALINEAVVGSDRLAGFGTVRKEDGSWTLGMLEVGLAPAPKVLRIVREIPYSSKGGDLASLLTTVTATAGGDPYALQFDEPSFLLNLRSGQRLKAFPAGFERLPALPKNEGQDSTAGRARVVDASTLPVALYGRGDFLYLLTREQKPGGRPVWRLHRIDPRKDVILDSVILPTTAAYLELAPGPSVWAILEESRGATGMLQSDGLLLVATPAIEGGGSLPPCV
jgi:hypothetical protein